MPKTDCALDALLIRARACTACDGLPLGPLPLVRAGATARLLIISQAPGTKAHASGLSFDDPSGDRLRSWLGMDRETFYDEGRVAIMPMGFCYPGRLPRGGSGGDDADLGRTRLRAVHARAVLVEHARALGRVRYK